jgi:phosphoenolpyruvate carboxylase
MQSRLGLPGWYGIGEALQQFGKEQAQLEMLRQM